MRALLFLRPPGAILERIDGSDTIGLYHATQSEAPARGYAKFFQERGHTLALPRVIEDGVMDFAAHTDPFDDSDLHDGPFGMAQPGPEADSLVPDILFVPLLGFTDRGERLGQGGGYYDRWLAKHRPRLAIGLAWDAQLVEALPTDPHDIRLDAVVTPTRLYGPFAREDER